MAILKIEILGSKFDINYEVTEKEKLLKLINKFKNRLNEFPTNINSNDKTVILLSALKIEDELEESKKLLLNNKLDNDKINEQSKIIVKLKSEMIILKNKINDFDSQNSIENNNNLLLLQKLQNLEQIINSIQEKITNELS